MPHLYYSEVEGAMGGLKRGENLFRNAAFAAVFGGGFESDFE
jgi:hypothetical protein